MQTGNVEFFNFALPTPSRLGAMLLDERCPGWFERIDMATLDMSGACNCILGQLYGSSESGCNALGVKNYRSFRPTYGFEASSIGGYMKNADALTREWCEHIEDRRAREPLILHTEA